MKFNWVIFYTALVFITIPSLAQTTYFIKYKSNVPIDVVESNISEKKLSNSVGFRPISLPDFNVNYLAKGLGRGDEILGRIVKVQFAQDVSESSLNSILANDPDIEYIQAVSYTHLTLPTSDLV